ncbi:tellurite resistance/C4-dicarboxylate transporter family protein [Glutamicibacter sp.]|uniref:tellurite resistance/C4-dicarboxylate transporter family protein n=1 Tax=Glutamicibacter sp. TaxID=1931995 RepID=UPI0028BDBDED|nr:tellurite resistance/C4-dicarboxylate transporter family protein [Glutamicibacter sp.]
MNQPKPAEPGPNIENTGLRRELEHLSPGYFALVMGTGIISVGLHDVGQEAISLVLLAIAAISYVLLWVLYIWRAIAYREAMLADLRAPDIAFAYFTVVAGTGVLAVRLGAGGWMDLSFPLVLFAATLWFVFGYLLPWQVLMTRDGRPILARTNGTWFIWAVSSQSVAIGMSVIQPYVTSGKYLIGLLAVMSWSVGVALYVGIAVLVLLRVVHFGITPKEFEPPYWVSMGAMAIAVVAGSKIVEMESTPMIDATRLLIAATVAMFWSFCVWLIPMLIGAGIWRHLVHKVPLKYVPTLWSIVFPLGMFSVASINLGRVDQLPVVEAVGHGALVVALIVWCIVFVAMLRHVFLVWWRGRTASS